jgi:hypothetical protein
VPIRIAVKFIEEYRSVLTLTLMMETEPVSETVVFNSALTRLITREDFIASRNFLIYTGHMALFE